MKTILLAIVLSVPPPQYPGMPPQCPAHCVDDTIPSYPSWQEVRPQAVAGYRSVAVFVGCNPRKVQGMLTACNRSYHDCSSPAILVAVPSRESASKFWRFDLPVTATDDDILFVAMNQRLPKHLQPRNQSWTATAETRTSSYGMSSESNQIRYAPASRRTSGSC